jgi:ureidoglycolate lyase
MTESLRLRPLTTEAFAPYGQVVDPRAAAASPTTSINGGTSQRHEALTDLDLQQAQGRAVLAVYDARARTFPFAARGLERHRLSDQVFLPLGGRRRAVVLVAPPGAEPSPGACEAFLTDGTQGVCIAAGTWHHGLLALDDGAWAVLERRARDGAVDNDEVHWAHPLLVPAPGG